VILVLFLDLMSKHLVSQGRFVGDYLGGFLRVTLVHNPGAAFGIFPGAGELLIGIKFVALVVILFLMARGRSQFEGAPPAPGAPGEAPPEAAGGGRPPALTLPLALIFAGALGNLLDRFRNGGEVIDFLDFGFGERRWYVFNLADAAISIGAVILILILMRRGDPDEQGA